MSYHTFKNRKPENVWVSVGNALEISYLTLKTKLKCVFFRKSRDCSKVMEECHKERAGSCSYNSFGWESRGRSEESFFLSGWGRWYLM